MSLCLWWLGITATSGQIMGLLTELNAQGKTVIMVTHEPDLARYAGSRLHMRDGLIDGIEGPSQ